MTEEKIARINELARKAKAEGLTEPEKKEQQLLRQEPQSWQELRWQQLRSSCPNGECA